MDDLPFASSDQGKRLEVDYTPAYTAWKQAPTPDTRHSLLQAVDPVIQNGIKAYGGASSGSPMLTSRARQLTLQSFDSYDPLIGGLRSHILNNLRRLQRDGAQQAQIISLPERVALDRQHLAETAGLMRDNLGRDPSDLELADRTGLSMKRLRYIRQARSPMASGQLERGQDDNDSPESMIPGVDHQQRGWEDLVYYDLEATNQIVFDMLLGRHGRRPHTTAEVATALRISPSAVSQRAAKLQHMLDERYTQRVM